MRWAKLTCLSLVVACTTSYEQPRSPVAAGPVAAATATTKEAPRNQPGAASAAAAQPAPASFFEVVVIDDSSNPFVVATRAELPDGVTWLEERITRIHLEGQPNLHSVHLLPGPGESFEQALARIDPWLRSIQLPPGARLGWQRLESFDDTLGKPVVAGWRSFVLQGAPVLTTSDLASAVPEPGFDGAPTLMLNLLPPASERFRIATRAHILQRMAILLDGVVYSAPIIQSEIAGGQLQLSLGEGTDRADVEKLARSLSVAAKQTSSTR